MDRPFAVSNIAWPASDLDEALALLPKLGFTAVEIAPFNVFGTWDGVLDAAPGLRQRITDHGLHCAALQGILYNVPGATLFDDPAALHVHLDLVARLAEVLGAAACVFGAPRQRDPGTLPPAEAHAKAVDVFRAIGPAFATRGTSLAIEANARRYACRFLVTTEEAAAFVAAVDTPGIGLQIDTGTILLEHEDPAVLGRAANAVHAHVSAPDLAPITPGPEHLAMAASLRASGYAGAISIEMRPTPDWRADLAAAASFVRSAYL